MPSDLMERVAQGTLDPLVGDTFGLDGIAGALQALATGRSRGKKAYVA
ncbi:MAG: hypothetical protein Q3979_05145 [Actinomycetaceae bacterium]|nr:hypothetical protein [Actinomycetaceae bacterium]